MVSPHCEEEEEVHYNITHKKKERCTDSSFLKKKKASPGFFWSSFLSMLVIVNAFVIKLSRLTVCVPCPCAYVLVFMIIKVPSVPSCSKQPRQCIITRGDYEKKRRY